MLRARWLLALSLSFATLPAIAQIVVSDGWVRGVVPGQTTTGAFMDIKSSSDVALVGVASSAAKVAEVHTMMFEGGIMKMRAEDRVPLHAGKTLELKPGAHHIMLMSLTRPLHDGDTVPIALTFEDKSGRRSSVDVTLPVKAATR